MAIRELKSSFFPPHFPGFQLPTLPPSSLRAPCIKSAVVELCFTDAL